MLHYILYNYYFIYVCIVYIYSQYSNGVCMYVLLSQNNFTHFYIIINVQGLYIKYISFVKCKKYMIKRTNERTN